jgi:cold shock CspA family protein
VVAVIAGETDGMPVVQVETHGTLLPTSIREMIDAHVAKIRNRCGRLTACRVVVRPPGTHHKAGEPYAVSIHITLPGQREINVGRISNTHDPRLSDLAFAVNDAFRRAMAQMRRQMQRLEGQTKSHRGPAIGHIARLDPAGDCGFLTTEDGREIYFHAHSVLGRKFKQITTGSRVSYHEEMGEKGPQASSVRLLSRHA